MCSHAQLKKKFHYNFAISAYFVSTSCQNLTVDLIYLILDGYSNNRIVNEFTECNFYIEFNYDIIWYVMHVIKIKVCQLNWLCSIFPDIKKIPINVLTIKHECNII